MCVEVDSPGCEDVVIDTAEEAIQFKDYALVLRDRATSDVTVLDFDRIAWIGVSGDTLRITLL
jgi:hypothetical protein